MEVIRGLYNWRQEHHGCVATLGNFDGVHHGHQMLLSHLNAKRDELGYPSVLVTFEPQPREYFRGEAVPARLTRFREKVRLLERTGIDRVLCLPFNRRLAEMPAEAVIDDLLVQRMGVQYVVIGDDFRFGKEARGDYAMMEEAGVRHGFGVSHMGTLTFKHGRVSSTRIREGLAAGDFATAERLLGHEYFIMGRVVYGRQLGRTLEFPTANIRLQRYQAAINGVFVVQAALPDGEVIGGVANIGMRPTVNGTEPLLEVHLFDFDRDIYGALLTVTFRAKVRDEQTFDGLPALQAQIGRDAEYAKAWLQQHGLTEPGHALSVAHGNVSDSSEKASTP